MFALTWFPPRFSTDVSIKKGLHKNTQMSKFTDWRQDKELFTIGENAQEAISEFVNVNIVSETQPSQWHSSVLDRSKY